MIPKGATIFVIVGVIGAGMLGAYLSEVSNQIPILVYQNGPSLTVIPDKINYHPGESVHIRIINSGTTTLTFSDSSYGFKILALDGTIIYSPISAQVISTLEPKEEKTFVWNQTKTSGTKVFEGRYQITSSTTSDTGNLLTKSVTINVVQ